MSEAESDIRRHYVDHFAGFEARLNGQSQTPVHALRRQAIDRFAATGFPTGRDEDWRHTNLSPITRIQFQPWSQDQTGLLQPADIAPYLVAGLAAHRLVFVNGQFDAALSDAPGADGEVAAGSLRDAVALDSGLAEHLGRNSARGGFDALNTAFLDDGAFVHVAAGVRAQMPIQLLFVTAPTIGSGSAAGVPTVSFPRTLVMLEAGAEATVVETYAGGGDVPYLTDAATEVFLGARSRLEHCRIQRESAAAFHVSRSHFHEEGESQLDSHSVDLGTRLCRNDIVTRLLGAGVKSILNGLYVTAGDQHVDNHTLIAHAAPGCESHELFKGVLGERSKAVFRGKIHVHQVAQKTDAYQSNQNLLLSDDADVTSKPQLEIYADDVKCSHGSTTGQLDDDAIFYLKARGIGDGAARSLLTRAFAGEILDRIPVEAVVRQVRELVADRLGALHQGAST